MAARRHTAVADYVYDAASNPSAVATPAGDTIRMKYDALNRLVRRIVPAVRYPAEDCPGDPVPGSTWLVSFPTYPNNAAGGLTVPGDTVTFTYDAAGRMTTAYNRSARIARSYYPNGLLATGPPAANCST